MQHVAEAIQYRLQTLTMTKQTQAVELSATQSA